MSIVFVYTQLNVKTVIFQTIQFMKVEFQCHKQPYFKQFTLAYKNSSISNNAIWHKNIVLMLKQLYFKQFDLEKVHVLFLFDL